jgi:hypothetical protein
VIGVALLALAPLLVAAFLLATVRGLRGLRDGRPLAPEPVAAIAPVSVFRSSKVVAADVVRTSFDFDSPRA